MVLTLRRVSLQLLGGKGLVCMRIVCQTLCPCQLWPVAVTERLSSTHAHIQFTSCTRTIQAFSPAGSFCVCSVGPVEGVV